MNLYLTADTIGGWGGGSTVTFHESEALKSLGPCEVWGRDKLLSHEPWDWPDFDKSDPWCWDHRAWSKLNERAASSLCHIYAGTFTKAVGHLKGQSCIVTMTAAAHDIQKSKQAHESLGLPFNYPHLTEPELWRRYVAGYLAADVLVCPSTHSANVMRGFGAKQRIEVIPHGCTLPAKVEPLPKRFVCGYLGSYGADKSVHTLLQAWKRLNYRDAVLLLGGRDSTGPWVRHLVETYGGGNIQLVGWVDDVSDFYNRLSFYVQPSVTEGFGIEVLEAMGHGRPVLCSTGAGAADVVPDWYRFEAGNAEELASMIAQVRDRGGCVGTGYPEWRAEAAKYEWPLIRERYISLWNSLLRT